MEPSSFLPIISGFLGGAASVGLFKGPIQTVEDWWYINYGYLMSEKAEMIRIKQSVNTELFKNSMLEEASKISPKDLKEPQLKILGPALEASKYYIEEKELRDMFAKIIASSMDAEKDQVIHTSFVEIIKQLDSLDAIILKDFSNGRSFNLGTIRQNTDRGYWNIISEFYLSDAVTKFSIWEISKSISNLKRLGLVETQELLFTDGGNHYDSFKNHPKIKKFITNISGEPNAIYETIISRMDVTPYGNAFLLSCVN